MAPPPARLRRAGLQGLILAAALLPRPASAGLGQWLQRSLDPQGYQRAQCQAMQQGRLSYGAGLARLGIEPSSRANAHLYALCRGVGAPFFAARGTAEPPAP